MYISNRLKQRQTLRMHSHLATYSACSQFVFLSCCSKRDNWIILLASIASVTCNWIEKKLALTCFFMFLLCCVLVDAESLRTFAICKLNTCDELTVIEVEKAPIQISTVTGHKLKQQTFHVGRPVYPPKTRLIRHLWLGLLNTYITTLAYQWIK